MAGSQADLPAGVKKDITRHPPSLRKLPPQDGDTVELHFTLKLKAGERQVDSSKDRGQPFVYEVGRTAVIEGWALAVKTMRQGEHARFVIAPPLAYGEAGSEELGVPPNSTVILELELLKCPTREDLFEDGGAIKCEVKDAPDGRHPRQADEMQVSFKVRLSSGLELFEQQRMIYSMGGGGERFGTMAKVLDKALSTMKRGDEALVTCRPGYAIAAGALAEHTAEIHLALEEIREVYDMSVGQRDKTVLRKRVKEGDGADRVQDLSTVTVDVLTVTAGPTDGSERIRSASQTVTFVVGNGQVCDALEGAVVGMRLGDEAILKCSSVEACLGGALDLPDSMRPPVIMHIAIRSFDKVREKWDLSSEERLQRGRERKEVATELFKRGRIRLACHLYDIIVDLFVKPEFFKGDEQASALELRRVANLNRAMCMLKMGDMQAVKELCSTVLGEDAQNTKALFRRAKAAVTLREYPEAIVDLERLLEIDQSSREGRELLREARRLRRQSDCQQSTTFAKMCAGLGDMPERTDRRDDDIVVMPDLRQEMAHIAERCGLPLHSVAGAEAVACAAASHEEPTAPSTPAVSAA